MAQGRKAYFLVDYANSPMLPPMDAEDGGRQLTYVNDAGERCGGYSIVQAFDDGTAIAAVHTSQAEYDNLLADPNVIFLSDIEEPNAEIAV